MVRSQQRPIHRTLTIFFLRLFRQRINPALNGSISGLTKICIVPGRIDGADLNRLKTSKFVSKTLGETLGGMLGWGIQSPPQPHTKTDSSKAREIENPGAVVSSALGLFFEKGQKGSAASNRAPIVDLKPGG